MGTLESGLSREDLDTLLESMDDWEAIGNHEFHVMQMVRNAPMPPDDHEAHEFMEQLKEHFKQREKEIKDTRKIRQEKAIFLKAKIMLIVRDLGINQLFENANAPASAEAPREVRKPVSPDVEEKLHLAEEFIKDLGVQAHYEKFLKEKAEKS